MILSADGTELLFSPLGCSGTICIPEGVKRVSYSWEIGRFGALHIPASLDSQGSVSHFYGNYLKEFSVAEGNPVFCCKDGVLYDITGRTLLCYPAAKADDVVIPEGVDAVCLESFHHAHGYSFRIHIGAEVELLDRRKREDGLHITIYAPAGSPAERYARITRCNFIEEGEPVFADDSWERKNRSMQEWRQYYNFSNRAKGSHVSRYLRNSKLAYLPDHFGKPLVASLEKDAFPEDVAVICSKRLFAKLAPENKLATVKVFLLDESPFQEEKAYLTDYCKKQFEELVRVFIQDKHFVLLKALLAVKKNSPDAFEKAIDVAHEAGDIESKAFLLNYQFMLKRQ